MRAFFTIATEGFGQIWLCGQMRMRGSVLSWLAGQSVKGICQPSGSNQGFWCMMKPIELSNCDHSHS
jgi:hypothetical protein